MKDSKKSGKVYYMSNVKENNDHVFETDKNCNDDNVHLYAEIADLRKELQESREVIKHQYDMSNVEEMIQDEKISNDDNDEFLACLIFDRKDMLDQIDKLKNMKS